MSAAQQPKGTFVPSAATEIEKVGPRTHYWYSKPGFTETEDLMLVRARIPPGEGHPFHYHPKMEEILYILSGKAEQWIDQRQDQLKPGDSVHIPAGLVHATYNATDEELEFLAILTPASQGEPFLVDVADQEPWKTLRA